MISIITPTYNRAHIIERPLKAVLNQSFEDWEMIIIDDGSTDNTEEVIQPYLEDKRIKYFKKENSGPAHSRNEGAKKASGTHLAFLDSDDSWDPTKLEILEKFINRHSESTCFYSGFRKKNSQSGRITQEFIPVPVPNITEELKTQNPIHAFSTVVVPRSIFEKVGGFDNSFKGREDVELYYRISKLTSFVGIPQILVTIYNNERTRISGDLNNRIADFKRYLLKHGQDMSLQQRSFLAKRIVALGFSNGTVLSVLRFLPLSSFSGVKGILRRFGEKVRTRH